MRLAIPPLLLLIVSASLAGSAPPSSGPAATRPSSAAALSGAIDTTQRRLDALVARSRMHKNHEVVLEFVGYSEERLQSSDRPVAIETLLKIVEDGDTPPDVRQSAADAITADVVQRNDPALSPDGKGARRPRAAFSLKVISLLRDRDPVTRALGNAILVRLWPGMSDPDVVHYDARRRETWDDARRSWDKFLRR